MSRCAALPVAYVPCVPGALRAEVQRLTSGHPARRWGPHTHVDFFELLVFEEAGGHHVLGGRRQAVESGHVAALRPGAVHDLGGVAHGGGWAVIFTAESLGESRATAASGLYAADPLLWAFCRSADDARDHVQLTGAQLASWREDLAEIAREQAERRSHYGRAIRALLTTILVDLARTAPAPGDVREVPLLEEVFAAVELLYPTGAGLAEVAQRLNRNAAHLTSRVRALTGRTVGEWLVQRRMVDARRRLVESDAPVGQIAADCGYRDVVHFHRQFRARHGVAPGAWRARALTPTDPPVPGVDPP